MLKAMGLARRRQNTGDTSASKKTAAEVRVKHSLAAAQKLKDKRDAAVPADGARMARSATIWLILVITAAQYFCYIMQNVGKNWGFGHRGMEWYDMWISLGKAQCYVYCYPERLLRLYYMPDGEITSRVVCGVCKAVLIYLFVWLVSLSVTDDDIREYRLEKEHEMKYNKYLLSKQAEREKTAAARKAAKRAA
mmetsp:Transcript_7969/g.15642  ORF Transcript_7969/g.15642 Transcript_7969/m.15642 type:complete len:193 (+) Transcript_7969:89-667(+)